MSIEVSGDNNRVLCRSYWWHSYLLVQRDEQYNLLKPWSLEVPILKRNDFTCVQVYRDWEKSQEVDIGDIMCY